MNIALPKYISGEYAVGTECFTVIDNDRKEVLGPGKGYRKIAVRMYYPTLKENVSSMERSDIFTERKIQALRKTYHIKQVTEEIKKADYYEHAVHVEDTKFPLVIYNHGYNAYVEANTFLCCELASNGYIVASVGHAHEAILNEYEDGTYDVYDKKINKMMYDNVVTSLIAQMLLLKAKGTKEEVYQKFDSFQRKHTKYILERLPEWGMDTMCVIRALKKRYDKWIDFSNGIGATGHSLGGATAYYLCQHEAEIACGINIDGGVFGNYEGMKMTKPFLQICCAQNYNTQTRPLFGTNAPVECEIFKDMKHIGFTDAKFFAPSKMLVGKMDAKTMYERLVSCHLQFLDKYLKHL
ncbi:MAG: hypothetical protein PUC39_01020 [Lachnospiraceae bacterium]|nr:hypothetical protein [Lachnospiraceae bacterium]